MHVRRACVLHEGRALPRFIGNAPLHRPAHLATGARQESDGAKCVFLDGYKNRDGEPLPMIVQKSDGGFMYSTTDLAAIMQRAATEEADRVLYVTDAGQSQHFEQVRRGSLRVTVPPLPRANLNVDVGTHVLSPRHTPHSPRLSARPAHPRPPTRPATPRPPPAQVLRD